MRLECGRKPQLVVLTPAEDRGRRIPLDGEYLVVGRERTCDVRFDDPHVSRSHAALEQRGNAVYVRDLGSSGGTFVNGESATSARELHAGDVLAFATATTRLEADSAPGEATMSMTRQRPDAAKAAGVDFRIERQDGRDFVNVGGDLHNNAYVQQVIHQRQNFLRDIAATRTRARWLAWTGFVVFLIGFGIFAATDLSFLKQIGDAVQNRTEPSMTSPFGREFGGVPIGIAGWALAAVGMIMLIVGIILHVVATARSRRVDREFPLPPWHDAMTPVRRAR
jgi:hypothetical protein